MQYCRIDEKLLTLERFNTRYNFNTELKAIIFNSHNEHNHPLRLPVRRFFKQKKAKLRTVTWYLKMCPAAVTDYLKLPSFLYIIFINL